MKTDILELLMQNRKGMGANQIAETLQADDLACVRVGLSNLTKLGMLLVAGRDECKTCRHPANCYAITAKGREYLENKLHARKVK